MMIDWNAAYNRLFPFIETRYTGYQFIRQIQQFDPDHLDPEEYFERMAKEEKRHSKKVYFKQIILSYSDDFKLKLFNFFIDNLLISSPSEANEIRQILKGVKPEVDLSRFDKSAPLLLKPLTPNPARENTTEVHVPEPKPDVIATSLPIVVILTAIKEEYLAVKEHLTSVEEIEKHDTQYEQGIFQFNNTQIARIIIRECGAKNTIASQETERAIQYFTPNAIFFVGIAGSRKPNDFGIGDVIIPEKIYSYEAGKADKGLFSARPDLTSMTYYLTEIAKTERRKEEWKSLIKGEWPKDVKADLGVIASGEQIIEHFESEIGDNLKRFYNDTSAVEMEGFGFAKAAIRQGRHLNGLSVGVIRGISDILQQSSSNKEAESNERRPPNAKAFAAATAAAFAFRLILKAYGQNS